MNLLALAGVQGFISTELLAQSCPLCAYLRLCMSLGMCLRFFVFCVVLGFFFLLAPCLHQDLIHCANRSAKVHVYIWCQALLYSAQCSATCNHDMRMI